MNRRISLGSSRARLHPALIVAGWLALELGCGRDTTTLQTESRDDVASEVESARALPPTAGETEPVAPESGMSPAPPEAPAESGAVRGASDGNPPVDGSRKPDDPPARDTPIEGVFGDWCKRMGVEPDEARNACIETALDYFEAVTEDCAVSGLVAGWSRDQTIDWGNYLIDYAYLFTGCPFGDWKPPEGGLSVFGPAHLELAGLLSPALGPDDARRLSEHFTTALVTMLGLTDSDSLAVERVLAASAVEQIDTSLSGVLSRCAGADPDAADAGAADAGR